MNFETSLQREQARVDPAPAPQARTNAPRRFGVLLLAALTLPLLVLVVFAWLAWRDTWKSAERELARGAEAAAEYVWRVLDVNLLAADLTNHLLRGLSDEQIRTREGDLHRELRQLLPSLPGVNTVVVLDREAEALLTANIYPVPRGTRFPDREWVVALREPHEPDPHISAVTIGRLDNSVFFGVSRRRAGTGNGLPDGAYDGLVNVSVNPNRLSAGLAAIAGPQGDVASLVRGDGALLARSTGLPVPPPAIPSNSRLRDAARAGETAGVYMGQTLGLPPDQRGGEARLIAFRRVGELPLYATVARPTPVILGRWRETFLLQLAVGLPAWGGLVGLALLLQRKQRALATVNAGLERRVAERTAELRDSEAQAQHALRQLDAVYATAPVGLCVLDPKGRYVRVNAEMAAMNGVPAEAHLGRTIREVVPDLADVVEPLHRHVVEAGEPVLGVEIEGETPAQPGVLRAWLEDWSPIHDANGLLVGVNVVAREVTAERAAEQALAESDARLREGATRLATLVDALPLGVALCDAEGRLLVANAAMRRFVPDVIPSRDEARRGRWRSYRADGSPLDHSDYPGARALRGEVVLPGVELIYTEDDGRETWTRVLAVPLRDERGVTGAVLIAADITEQKASEERQMLLTREVSHRAKNALAVVQAALRLTRKDSAEAYAMAIEGRVAALARAHTILAAGQWESAALRDLIEAELATFQPAGGPAEAPRRITVEGPQLALAADAVQALSMAVHELATNAAKYGALSAPGGRVSVTWRVDGSTDSLTIVWRESGGPTVTGAPERRGFGSRVVEATVQNQLGGQVERAWKAEGLVCIMTVPVARAIAAGAATAA